VLGKHHDGEGPIFAESPAIGVNPDDQPGGHVPHDPTTDDDTQEDHRPPTDDGS
jgi:hypothetical protein